jgi:glyoxylase-like metal-dependent hydrolase (beta-lactamase superfamily II)
MADLRVDVIAIGSLAKNKYWKEKTSARNEFSTVSLVRSGDMVMVVDPGWPAEVLRASLYYRSGLDPKDVTHVFCTHLDAAHIAGMVLFEKAQWYVYEEELTYADAEWPADAPARTVLERLTAAPEKFAPGVDLYPTFGHTPGHASIIVYSPMNTMVITGDAVLTRDHFEHGDLGDGPWDLEKAKTSFQDIAEIADLIIPGHDNIMLSRATGSLL